jgi:Holliday junction DNA helicase RuvA
MIAQLTGNFLHKTPTRVIIDTNGVGYEVNISLNTYSAIANASSGTLFTHLKISEDAFTIYGFADASEKEMFLKLLSVSGVGAATARMMLSSLKPVEVQMAISSGNVKLLESIKGIGKKTAERIALELRDKLAILPSAVAGGMMVQHNTPETEALEGLMALGIGKAIAEQALRKATASNPGSLSVENLIKLALKLL